MAKCFEIAKKCQHVEARLDYLFDWTRQFSRRWQRDHSFGAGVVVRPEGDPTGFEYISAGGHSAAEEPAWPRVLAGTVTDGSITWTAQAISATSLLEHISTDSWTVDDSALTVEGQFYTDTAGLQATRAIISGGVAGTTYTVENEVITDLGLEYMARIILTVEQ
jgi:hypothetical protein